MIKIIPKPKKLPKFPRNLKNYKNSLETNKMTKRLLEPLIYQKYPRNIQNTLNLYFSNLDILGVFWSPYIVKGILVIIWVSGIFIDHFF